MSELEVVEMSECYFELNPEPEARHATPKNVSARAAGLRTVLPSGRPEAAHSGGGQGSHRGRSDRLGKVASTRFASSTRGQPTFLNIDKPYPNQVFTIIIWGNNRARFGNPEVLYRDKRICVTGRITEYRGTAEIEARVPSQITIEKE